MEISERHDSGILVLRPVGRLNNDTSPEFQAKLLGCVESNDAVLIDFSGVEYVSSAGLRALMMAAKSSKAKAHRVAVTQLSPVVKEIFEISRFSSVVQVFETVQEGLAALRQPAA